MNDVVMEVCSLSRSFIDGNVSVNAVKDVNMKILAGETNAIIGSSGSGKTTLLHLIAGLDVPDKGEVLLKGSSFSALSHVKRGRLRNLHIGFVYQFHHLLHEFSALENVMLPLRICGDNTELARKKSLQLLDRVGLLHRLTHKPAELSGGERQRVAIARALVTSPAVVLADELTGNLDSHNAQAIEDLILELNEELNTAFLLVTHDLRLANKMQHIYQMVDGSLECT